MPESHGNGAAHDVQLVDAYGRAFRSAALGADLGASLSADVGLRVAAGELGTTSVLDRYVLARMLGMTHGGKRDTYTVFGYDDTITAAQYRERYARGGLAKRIVESLPKAVWRGDGTIYEDEDPEKVTPFEQAWQELNEQLGVWSTLMRAHILASLSSFSTLLLGAPGDLSAPLPRGKPGQLLYLTPFGGGVVTAKRGSSEGLGADVVVQTWDENPRSRRFGLPVTYQIKRTTLSTRAEPRPVHWTRVIHIPASGFLDDPVYGPPVLESVWNYLLDLDKVAGGGAEAFWRLATRITQIDIDKKMALEDAKDSLPALKEQIELIEHTLSRFIRTRGVNINEVGGSVSDFAGPADAIVTLIAGTTSIPKRILLGSERGELASGQDADNWDDQVKDERKAYAHPIILRPFIDRLIEYGYLPTPKQWEPEWPDVAEMTELEKLDAANKAASLNSTSGERVITGNELRERYLDLEPLDEDELLTPQAKADAQAKAEAEAQAKADAALEKDLDDDEDETVEKLEAALRRGGTLTIAVGDTTLGGRLDDPADPATKKTVMQALSTAPDVTVPGFGQRVPVGGVPRVGGGPGSGNFGHAGRPGEVGGSAPGAPHDVVGIRQDLFRRERRGPLPGGLPEGPSEAFRREMGTTADEMRAAPLPATLTAAQDRIRNEPNEHGFLIHDGRIDAYYGSDNPRFVQLPRVDKDGRLYELAGPNDPMRDAVFVHNHPSGQAFSPDDAFVAASHNMKEIRAVVPGGAYVLRRTGTAWPDPKYLHSVVNIKALQVRETFQALIAKKSLTVPQAERTHWKTVWPAVVNEVNASTTQFLEVNDRKPPSIEFTFEPTVS